MGKKKVVLDTNILISALGWQGKPKEVFRKCVSGEEELITSVQQLNELRDCHKITAPIFAIKI